MATEDTDRIKMYVNIGEERISLKVPFESQDEVRETEAHIDDLYNKWRKAFPHKQGPELLAMLAYQYASFYLEMTRRENQATGSLREFDARLGRLLDEL